MTEPRKAIASKYRVAEHSAQQATDPPSQLTAVAARMLTEIVAHDGIRGTLSGAYEVRIEVVPVDQWRAVGRCPVCGQTVPGVRYGEYECLDEHDNPRAELCYGGGCAAGEERGECG